MFPFALALSTNRCHLGSILVNTARGAIVDRDAVAEALKSGQISGYGGDVWFPQPAPDDHPLRYAYNPSGAGNAMTPHMSGTSVDAQIRYANGTKDIIETYLNGDLDHGYRHEVSAQLFPGTCHLILKNLGSDCQEGRICYSGIRTGCKQSRKEVNVRVVYEGGRWRFRISHVQEPDCLDGSLPSAILLADFSDSS